MAKGRWTDSQFRRAKKPVQEEDKMRSGRIVENQFDIFPYNTCPQSVHAVIVISQQCVRYIKEHDSLLCLPVLPPRHYHSLSLSL